MPDINLPDIDEVAPPPPGPGTWHHMLPYALRRHLVGKFVRAILPEGIEENDVTEAHIRELVLLATAIENECFQAAVDHEDYYHQLAEAVFEEQRRRRGHEVRQAN